MNNSKVITANLNDIVYEGRNQEYGGYVIRKNFNRRMFISLIIVSSAVILLAVGSWLAPVQTGVGEGLSQTVHELINIPILPEPEEITLAPPLELEREKPKEQVIEQPKEPIVTKKTGMDTEKSQVPVPDKTTTIDNSITKNENFKDKNPGKETTTGNTGTSIGTPPGKDKGKETPPVVNNNVEPKETTFHPGKMPEALNMGDIKKKVTYPVALREFGLQGKVIFRVLVGPDGEYIRHIVKRSDHPEFTKSCEGQLKRLKFTPGEENGKAVKVWVTIPFKFTLSN